MTQKKFLVIVVACNILFLFVYIHKQSWVIQLTYAGQKNETILADLQQQEKHLFNKLQERKKHTTIQNHATNKLGMHKAKLQNIKVFETANPAPTDQYNSLPYSNEPPPTSLKSFDKQTGMSGSRNKA